MSVFAGLCYGQMFTPYTYITDNYPDEPKNGIFLKVLFSVIKKTDPWKTARYDRFAE